MPASLLVFQRQLPWGRQLCQEPWCLLKEATGGEFRVYRGFHKASIRYVDLLEGFYNGNYPPENVLDAFCSQQMLNGKCWVLVRYIFMFAIIKPNRD